MELTEDFLKLLTTGISVVGILGIFFIFLQYNILIDVGNARMEAITLGDSLISSRCLAETETINGKEYPIKGLLSEAKLNDEQLKDAANRCIKYNKGIIAIKYLDSPTPIWKYELSADTNKGDTTYFVAIKDSLGVVKMASLEVEI